MLRGLFESTESPQARWWQNSNLGLSDLPGAFQRVTIVVKTVAKPIKNANYERERKEGWQRPGLWERRGMRGASSTSPPKCGATNFAKSDLLFFQKKFRF